MARNSRRGPIMAKKGHNEPFEKNYSDEQNLIQDRQPFRQIGLSYIGKDANQLSDPYIVLSSLWLAKNLPSNSKEKSLLVRAQYYIDLIL